MKYEDVCKIMLKYPTEEGPIPEAAEMEAFFESEHSPNGFTAIEFINKLLEMIKEDPAIANVPIRMEHRSRTGEEFYEYFHRADYLLISYDSIKDGKNNWEPTVTLIHDGKNDYN